MSQPVKIGLWGGAGGQPRDTPYPSVALVRVVVRSAEAINAITFTYKDSNGTKQEEKWGGLGGNKHTFELEDSEYVKEISGTYGPWKDVPAMITSLKFVTSKGETHQYGCASSGGSFQVPVFDGRITGFFGRAGDLIDAIGVYVLRP